MSMCPPVSTTSTSIEWINVKENSAAPLQPPLCAAGDGHTDDTTAIQQCITNAIALGGSGVVYLPPGTYQITRPLTVDGPCTIMGLSGGAGGLAPPTLVMSSLSFNAIEVNASDVLIRDLAIAGPTSGQTVTSSEGIGIHLTTNAVKGATIIDVSMTDVSNGVLIDGTSEVYCERVRVQPYAASTTKGDRFGFRAQGSGQVAEFLDCTVDESPNTGNLQVTAAFDCMGAYTSFLVAQCVALSTYYGYRCSTTGNFFFVANCLADSCYRGAFLDSGIAALIEACRFSNNAYRGIEVSTNYTGSPISFANVVVDGSTDTGVDISGGTPDQSITFTGGAISNAGVDGMRIAVQGLLSVSGISIEASSADGVHILKTHSGTVALSGIVERGSGEFGLHVEDASGTYVTTGCSFSGDAVGSFSDACVTPTRRCASTVGINPRGNLNQSPLVNTATQNPFGVVASVYVSGAATKVEIGESPTALSDTQQTAGLFRVGVGEYIKVTGTASWVWFGD